MTKISSSSSIHTGVVSRKSKGHRSIMISTRELQLRMTISSNMMMRAVKG